MSVTTDFPTAESALTYRQAHDKRVKALSRMTMPTLRETERAYLTAQGRERITGGPCGRDELISAILAIEFPAALINQTAHVLYHKPGEHWSACEYCQESP